MNKLVGITTNNFNYRYGFNGKEKDNAIKGQGNSYDYGFRMYDPRIGRPISLDPLFKKFPELSPYQFFTNNPIRNIDLDGLEGTPAKQDKNGGLTSAQSSILPPKKPIKPAEKQKEILGANKDTPAPASVPLVE